NRPLIGDVSPFVMRNRNCQRAPTFRSPKRPAPNSLNENILANKTHLRVANQSPRQYPGFRQYLKPIANPEHRPALVSKPANFVQNRRLRGYRSTTQIISVRKATWNNNRIETRKRRRTVPNILSIQ